jgi:predicted CoA-binding protein
MSQISALLQTPHTFAIVGVSQDPEKYGYEIFEYLTNNGHIVFPINPKYETIDGKPCYPALTALPSNPDAVITAIPASASAKIAETCAMLKIQYFWMAPGTDSEEALEICNTNNVTAIHDICPVFVLKMPRERWAELP